MRVERAMLAMVAACGVLAWDLGCEAATTAAVKLCGRKLSEIMSRVCHEYNSPSWDDPSVEQPAGVVRRRRRQLGIADECCIYGCTWEQLTDYCAISSKLLHPSSETPMDNLEAHLIADRSVEGGSDAAAAAAAPAVVGAARGEVGRARSRGYGRTRKGLARGRRCWCRKKRRTSRRRPSLIGNMATIRNVVRAAPVVGTVSPLLTWGRTLHSDLPPVEKDRYAYVSIYNVPKSKL